MRGEAPAERPGTNAGRVAAGLIVAGIGLLLLLDRMGVVDFTVSGRLWPFILIAIGAGRTAADPRRPAVWLLLIGAWGLVSEYRLFGLDYRTSWPLLVIAVGLGMVWRALAGPPGRARRRVEKP